MATNIPKGEKLRVTCKTLDNKVYIITQKSDLSSNFFLYMENSPERIEKSNNPYDFEDIIWPKIDKKVGETKCHKNKI